MKKIRAKFNQAVCFCIQHTQKPIQLDNSYGYVTVFHDYESDYALPNKAEVSYYGISKILDIEKKYNIKATYNTVGALFNNVPEIIERIIGEGHDIASHSYIHDVITGLNKKEIDNDIKTTSKIFEKYGIKLKGMRSPQSRWNFVQMKIMLDNGLFWTAENDKSKFPYIIYKKNKRRLIRFPIVMDDWEYISKRISPDEMYKKLINKVNEISKRKYYGAIGFHPWVQGENEGRLEIFEKFIKKLVNMKGIKIKNFDQIFNLISND